MDMRQPVVTIGDGFETSKAQQCGTCYVKRMLENQQGFNAASKGKKGASFHLFRPIQVYIHGNFFLEVNTDVWHDNKEKTSNFF